MPGLTNGVSTQQWLEVSKGHNIAAYLPSNIHDGLTEGLSSQATIDQGQPSNKRDAERDLGKVCRRIKK